MCEHEWITLTGHFGENGGMGMTACHKCMKSSGEIAIEQQDAIANAPADVAELLAEVRRLNELLGQRCANCHLKVEEAADNG